jgi:hypothetical protein
MRDHPDRIITTLNIDGLANISQRRGFIDEVEIGDAISYVAFCSEEDATCYIRVSCRTTANPSSRKAASGACRTSSWPRYSDLCLNERAK